MAHVFAPSLLGPRQDATLALHQCWADESERTARGAGGAPPPPLMVMVAAMLRKPALDAVRVADPAATIALAYQDAQNDAQRAVILNLVAKDDVEGIEVLQLAQVVPSAKARSDYTAPYLYHSLVWGVLDAAAVIAWRTRSYRSLVAAVKRFGAEYRRMHRAPLTPSLFYRSSPSSYRGVVPLPLTKLCPHVLKDIFASCSDTEIHGAASNLDPLDDVLRAHFEATAAACAELPVGDVRALLERHRHAADHSGVLSDLLAYASRRAFSAAEARAALVELGRGDVAAMLFAAAPDSNPVDLERVHVAARDFEFPSTLARHPTSRDHGLEFVDLSECRLLKAYHGDGSPVVRPAHTAPRTDTRHVLLSRVAANAMATRVGAAAPYRARGDFERHWKWQLRGLLGDGWDWSNCVAAGGAVVRALVGPDADTMVPEDPLVTTFGDVDLFFYGLSYAEQRRRLQELERHVRGTVGAGRYAVLLTSRTATIVVENAPRLQVALGRWSSAADVLSTSDVDCCGAGYDGSEVWLTGRAAAAYATRMNVADAMGQVVRGSIQYEMRLWKYAARYGFAVLDPLHDGAAAAEVLSNLSRTTTGGAQRSEAAAARHLSTNLTGLRWLMAVDAGLLEPVDALSDLAVGGSTTLAMVLAKVTREGYTKSDNYGTREEGYVLAQESGDAAAEASPLHPQFDQEGYFDWSSPIHNHNFAQFVGLSDVDRIDIGDIKTEEWQL